jgi:hypothetical protein
VGQLAKQAYGPFGVLNTRATVTLAIQQYLPTASLIVYVHR